MDSVRNPSRGSEYLLIDVGRPVKSDELVPGDVFEVSDPSIQLFPCDCLLLSGDAIVNESMLTGESVPVSKTPVTDQSLQLLDLSASTVAPELAKNFLFCGTKIIRARKPQEGEDDEDVAVAMVVRTGFNTTKGALVRSMLFPKPSGFKFYKDAFYYIGVMGIIAGLGFIASIVNFIRLGVSTSYPPRSLLTLPALVAKDACPRFGSDHYCRPSCPTGHFDDWNQLCSGETQVQEDFLHQSTAYQYWRKTRRGLLRQNRNTYRRRS